MLILTITKYFINSKCKCKGFLSLIPWCSFYFYDSCSFPAECYFQGSQFMHFRSEQCFGNSKIWLKKYKTSSEVLSWRPRNARSHVYDQHSSPFLLFLLQEQKHNTSSAFWFWCWIARECLILSVNSKLSAAFLRLWSATLSTVSWDRAALSCCKPQVCLKDIIMANSLRSNTWQEDDWVERGWKSLFFYLWAVMLIAEFWSLNWKKSSVTDVCTRCQNAISLVTSNKSAAVV